MEMEEVYQMVYLFGPNPILQKKHINTQTTKLSTQ